MQNNGQSNHLCFYVPGCYLWLTVVEGEITYFFLNATSQSNVLWPSAHFSCTSKLKHDQFGYCNARISYELHWLLKCHKFYGRTASSLISLQGTQWWRWLAKTIGGSELLERTIISTTNHHLVYHYYYKCFYGIMYCIILSNTST